MGEKKEKEKKKKNIAAPQGARPKAVSAREGRQTPVRRRSRKNRKVFRCVAPAATKNFKGFVRPAAKDARKKTDFKIFSQFLRACHCWKGGGKNDKQSSTFEPDFLKTVFSDFSLRFLGGLVHLFV